MKALMSCSAAVALLAGVAIAGEKEPKSGLQVGDSVGAFDVVKYGGAEDDGVSVGQKLCYR